MDHRPGSHEIDRTMEPLTKSVIESELGSTDTLPEEVTARIRRVYGEFIPAYIDIIRIRDGHSHGWQPRQIAVEPDVVEDMRHFYSDYQDITRSFILINRQVKNLRRIDRQADPHRFERCVREIVSGSRGSTIMDSLLER